MIGKHHHPHAGFLRRREHLCPSASGVSRILRVDMDDGAIILVNAEVSDCDSLAGKLQARFMGRLQVLGFQALDRSWLFSGKSGRGGEEQSRTPKAVKAEKVH